MSDRNRRMKWRLGAAGSAAVLLIGILFTAAFAGPVSTVSGFEDDDANLIVNSTFDWNGFNPTTWTGTAPYRVSTKTVAGWKFAGIEDEQAKTSDTGFAGGVKQDDACPSVIGSKAPNKDDLKRIYLSSKTVPVSGVDHVILNLAWVRIPQNTTSPSAHVAFEFNKSSTLCGAGSGGLVQRSAGDMLIVYDFEGGAGTPVLTLRRWVTSGACEISSDTAPCWGVATNLTASGFADAKVNTGNTALDTIGPNGNETLGLSEFGEAGIDLTAAGVFTAGNCDSFGNAYGVSRSSGNSGTAQMKDLVGPAPFLLQNCGTVTIIKQTDPRGLNQNFSYTSNLAGNQMVCTTDTTPASFTLNDNGNSAKTLGSKLPAQNSTGNTETCTNVPAGGYSVTEGADPTGFAFDSLSCDSTGGASTTTSTKTANITMVGGGTVTCLYINKQQLGAIKIIKSSSKTNNRLAGATFSITKGGTAITGSPFTTNSNGVICVDNLAFGDYVVTETGAPTGFAIDDATGHTVTVDNNAKCSDSSYGGESISFTDTPTSDVQVRFRDGGSGETHLANGTTLTCNNVTGTSSDADTNGWDDTHTVSGIKVTSSTVTVTCTIVIDP